MTERELRYKKALERIAKWFGEFPATGKFIDKEKTVPASYAYCWGSNGERDFMRKIASDALKDYIKMYDIKMCECCGQCRPFPTNPGKWEYKSTFFSDTHWQQVEILQDKEGLIMIPFGEKKPTWWPPNVEWRKIE